MVIVIQVITFVLGLVWLVDFSYRRFEQAVRHRFWRASDQTWLDIKPLVAEIPIEELVELQQDYDATSKRYLESKLLLLKRMICPWRRGGRR